MNALVAAELLKLRTTKTFIALGGVLLGLVLVATALAASLRSWGTTPLFAGETTPSPFLELIAICAFAPIFTLVLGIFAVTSEYRHGTITPSLIFVPRRRDLFVAKCLAHGVAGTALGLGSILVGIAVMVPILAGRGVDLGVDAGDVLAVVTGGTLVSTLMCVLGVGLGAIVRNQAGAIVAAFSYLFIVEPTVLALGPTSDVLTTYGVTSVMTGLAGTDRGLENELLHQLPAGFVLAGYALTFAVVGCVLFARRDIKH